MKRWLVIAMRRPQFDASLVAPHHAFLDELRTRGQLERNGGFADKSGGAYVLLVDSAEQARAIVERDPLNLGGASDFSVHEWNLH